MNKLKAIKSFIFESSMGVIKGYMIKAGLIILGVIIAVGSVFKAIDYASSRYACHIQWQESRIDYKYTLRGGCLLKRGEGWIPAKNFRVE